MIAVTGASGFIGRQLVLKLAETWSRSQIRCFVKDVDDDYSSAGTHMLRSNAFPICLGDLVSGRGLENLGSPEIVFHLGANTHTWESDHSCNDLGTINLLEALPLGPRSHVIFTSTTAVMDNRTDFDQPLRLMKIGKGKPLSNYGCSKKAAEEILQSYAAIRGFRLSIVRLCTVYGPDVRPNTFFDVLKRQVRKKTVISRLNWPALTSFIHVNDVVECLIELVRRARVSKTSDTYLLATESLRVSDVARLLYEVQGTCYKIIKLPAYVWRLVSASRLLCKSSKPFLPTYLYNWLWRLNITVNPVFHCDTNSIRNIFPGIQPRLLIESIGEI